MSAHVRQLDEHKVGNAPGQVYGHLYRFPCSCGWRGSWYPTYTGAERSHEQHVRLAGKDYFERTSR